VTYRASRELTRDEQIYERVLRESLSGDAAVPRARLGDTAASLRNRGECLSTGRRCAPTRLGDTAASLRPSRYPPGWRDRPTLRYLPV